MLSETAAKWEIIWLWLGFPLGIPTAVCKAMPAFVSMCTARCVSAYSLIIPSSVISALCKGKGKNKQTGKQTRTTHGGCNGNHNAVTRCEGCPLIVELFFQQQYNFEPLLHEAVRKQYVKSVSERNLKAFLSHFPAWLRKVPAWAILPWNSSALEKDPTYVTQHYQLTSCIWERASDWSGDQQLRLLKGILKIEYILVLCRKDSGREGGTLLQDL